MNRTIIHFLLLLVIIPLAGCGAVGKPRAVVESKIIPYAKPVADMAITITAVDGSVTRQNMVQYFDRFDEYTPGSLSGRWPGHWSTVSVLYSVMYTEGICTDFTWSEGSVLAAYYGPAWAR